MNHADHLNRPRFPDVNHYIRVEVPEAILAAEEFIVMMANARSASQTLKTLVKLRPEALGSFRTVLGNVEKNRLSSLASGVRTNNRFTNE
jgi:hypothetical protein